MNTITRSVRMTLPSPRSSRGGRRITVGAAALLASVAIHVFLIQVVIWSSGGSINSPRIREGLGANPVGVADEAITTAFFVEDSSATPTSDDDALLDLASAGRVLQSLGVTILSPDPSIDSALKDGDTEDQTLATDEQSAGERQARAALFGRYVGQIQARVERAWIRPRAPIGADSFDCRVQVLQNLRGEVQEVTLQRCNGSAQWQQSLVRAIERASPLPAPPDAAVFSNSLLMSFAALAYGPGSEPELYEPEMPSAAATVGLSRTTYLSEGH